MSQLYPKMFLLLENYDFKFENLSENLKCIICTKILKNANQTSCGCKVCEKCIRGYLKDGSRTCPSKQPDCMGQMLNIKTDINQDNATNRDIANLQVNCPAKECYHRNSLKNMINHMEICEYREIKCEKCLESFLPKDKMMHDQMRCKMRNVSCKHCGSVMTSKDLDSEHLNPNSDKLCSKFVDFCPNKCSVKEKVNWKKHLEFCTNKKLGCPFHSFGCEAEKMTKENLSQHIEVEFCDHISSLINEIKSKQLKIEHLEEELKSQKEMVKELLKINESSTKSHVDMENMVEEFKRKTPPSIQTIVDKTIHIRNGSYIWKFSDFESRRVDAETGSRISITSDPFFTSDFGYKMCLRIYPAGDGVGKGTHLSVFFAIMKGDYDDLLSWPFKQKVTLSIFDLDSGTKHHSDTFKPDSKSACYQKPVDECNIASGSPRFIMLTLLTSSESIYCRNDTIFLKISVDTTGISRP